MTVERVWLPSPNWSNRGGTRARLLVVHTAEGASNFYELGAYFASTGVQASSHVGIDDTPGAVGEYVPRDDKAWTQANANPYSVAAELCAFAKWDAVEWDRHPIMLANCAGWLAEESAALGIPLVALTEAQAQGGAAGVCQHADLGAAGGGHWDCGSSFPLDRVLSMASGGGAPPDSTLEDSMVLTDPGTGGVWVTDATGAVFAYDGAPYLGAANNPALNANGWPCVGVAAFTDPSGPGYCLVLDAGAAGEGDRYRRYRFPRDGSARP